MTASRHEWILPALIAAALAACRAGLPPEPPGADPAAADAATAPYQPPPNAYEVSAFAGEPAPKAEEHQHHGAMDHAAMDHAATDHAATDHAAAAQPESPR